MGKGGGGRGGGGGGGGGASRFRFLRGLSRIGGPCPDTQNVLRHVAIARGIRDVDQLLVGLGKQAHEVSLNDAYDLLRKEGGSEAVIEAASSNYYRPGKVYRTCNQLLESDLQGVSEDSEFTEIRPSKLKKYCGYTDEELAS